MSNTLKEEMIVGTENVTTRTNTVFFKLINNNNFQIATFTFCFKIGEKY
jgi:hypothetical protein